MIFDTFISELNRHNYVLSCNMFLSIEQDYQMLNFDQFVFSINREHKYFGWIFQ